MLKPMTASFRGRAVRAVTAASIFRATRFSSKGTTSCRTAGPESVLTAASVRRNRTRYAALRGEHVVKRDAGEGTRNRWPRSPPSG
jgi:hypothetical protein